MWHPSQGSAPRHPQQPYRTSRQFHLKSLKTRKASAHRTSANPCESHRFCRSRPGCLEDVACRLMGLGRPRPRSHDDENRSCLTQTTPAAPPPPLPALTTTATIAGTSIMFLQTLDMTIRTAGTCYDLHAIELLRYCNKYLPVLQASSLNANRLRVLCLQNRLCPKGVAALLGESVRGRGHSRLRHARAGGRASRFRVQGLSLFRV